MGAAAATAVALLAFSALRAPPPPPMEEALAEEGRRLGGSVEEVSQTTLGTDIVREVLWPPAERECGEGKVDWGGLWCERGYDWRLGGSVEDMRMW